MALLPRGFLLATAEAGVKKPGRKDLLLICSEAEASVAGVFTTNKVKGAPVKLALERIASGRGRAIVANSGNANVCTGAKGLRDAREMASVTARSLGIDEDLLYVSSTGVIGTPLPMERIRPALVRLAGGLGQADLEEAAGAIMTTDTFPKFASKSLRISGREVRLAAVAKGAGMIHPKMATMLCFIMTDAKADKRTLNTLLKGAAEKSFNRVTVDGDRSTSDTAFLMANGLSGAPALKRGTPGYDKFKKALDEMTYTLACMMARDGEGATKLIELEVKNAATPADALKGAFAVANSLLFKTAMYGNDANWGRILAALGSCGIALEEEKVDISIGRIKIVKKGTSTGNDARANRSLRENREIKVTVSLGLGKSSERVLTCDLSEEYVRVNAEYRT